MCIRDSTNIDVRLAATRALGNFPVSQAASAIGLALNDPDPALQLRAAESLQAVTGEPFGRDIPAWQEYVAGLPGAGDLSEAGTTQVAEQPTGRLLTR